MTTLAEGTRNDMIKYTTVRHPRSGEVYAVQLDDGEIVRAAGPLHHADSHDPERLHDYLDNQLQGDTEDDAAWLREEMARQEA